MTNETFMEILKRVRLPKGTLLKDGTTFKLSSIDYPRQYIYELQGYEKILVLSDGNFNVVGGVLFYCDQDIQVTTFPEFRKKGYMSAIHKNGILLSELYQNQKVSIAVDEIRCHDDFLVRHHLLQLVGLKAKNLSEVYKRLYFFKMICCNEEEFLNEFN